MASRQLSAKKPKDLGHTLRTLLSYLGRHKLLFLAVAVLVALSALANLLGTYMIRPVVNSLAAGSLNTLVLGVAVTAAIYGAGVLSALGYTQIMVKAAQKVLYDIRRDLFAHIQTLPLRFFDTQRHGDVMSYFTNDVDTISEALNNSFAMLILQIKAHLYIHLSIWLIHQQQVGLHGKGTSDDDSLLRRYGQFSRISLPELLKSHQIQYLVHPAVDFSLGNSLNLKSIGQVILHGQPRKGAWLLEYKRNVMFARVRRDSVYIQIALAGHMNSGQAV